MKITAKQEAFAQAIVEGDNAADAYRKAYAVSPDTKPETIYKRAHELLHNGKVAGRIGELRERLMKRHDVTIDRIVAELAKMGFANMQDYMRVGPDGQPVLDWSMITRDQAAALVEVTVDTLRREGEGHVERVKFKLADKRGALVDLGKHLGMFVERHEHTGANGGPIQHEEVSREANEFRSRLSRLAARTGTGEAPRRTH